MKLTRELPVQVNGKLRGTIQAPAGADQAEVKTLALAVESIQRHIEGKNMFKVIATVVRRANISHEELIKVWEKVLGVQVRKKKDMA